MSLIDEYLVHNLFILCIFFYYYTYLLYFYIFIKLWAVRVSVASLIMNDVFIYRNSDAYSVGGIYIDGSTLQYTECIVFYSQRV